MSKVPTPLLGKLGKEDKAGGPAALYAPKGCSLKLYNMPGLLGKREARGARLKSEDDHSEKRPIHPDIGIILIFSDEQTENRNSTQSHKIGHGRGWIQK